MPEEVPDESGPVEVPEPEQSRWREYWATLRVRAYEKMTTAEQRRQSSKVYDAAFRVYERNRLLPASVLVGALASRIVVYLIPLLALLVFSFGFYEDVGGSGTEAASSIAGVFAVAVEDSRDVSEGFRFAAVIATLFAVLYAANSLGRLVRRATALIWGVPYVRSKKPWTPPIAVLAISALALLITSLGSWSDEWTWQATLGAVIIEFVLLTTLWVFVSRALPHDPAASKLSHFVPGALFVALGIVGLRLAMVIYFVPQSADLSQRYGSIGVALVMLTWAYWLGMIIVGSSEVNAALLRATSGREGAERTRESA
ncbi:MAG TPA: YhjD/YihY/BrkB family envelope integrity protein [Acidimicrobiia bacterium]